MNTNIEIKARCDNPGMIRDILHAHNARFAGTDEQVDTYFNVPAGRLKLRTGNIENNLIFYQRPDHTIAKQSQFSLVKVDEPNALREILTESLGIFKIVRKRREIYFIENVKFHIDILENLGSFVEIEAGNLLMEKSIHELRGQCDFYMKEFGITNDQLISGSYSDMI